MADKKISALTAATTPLAGTEVLPIVQSGSTVKVSVNNLTVGKPVSVGSLASAGSINVADNFSVNWGNGNSYITGNGAGFGLSAYVAATKIWSIDGSGATTFDFPVNLNNVNLVIGTAGKGITTSVANGDVTVTPLGTGKTILAKNGLRIPNNAAITVGTSATQISVNAVSWSSLAFVFGVDGGGNAFSDLVFYADGTTVALASRTVNGVPVTRTYTAPAGQLNLAMLSGSYSVFFQHIWLA